MYLHGNFIRDTYLCGPCEYPFSMKFLYQSKRFFNADGSYRLNRDKVDQFPRDNDHLFNCFAF